MIVDYCREESNPQIVFKIIDFFITFVQKVLRRKHANRLEQFVKLLIASRDFQANKLNVLMELVSRSFNLVK